MDCYSIFIPQLSSFYNQKAVIEVMERFHIGLVHRVDFVSIHNPGPGFSENVKDDFVSAYVHFDFPYVGRDQRENKICNNEFWNIIESNLAYRLQVNQYEQWICMKNHCHVPFTRMNIHQVVQKCQQLECVVAAQREHIHRLEQLVVTHDRTLHALVANMLKTQQQHITTDSLSTEESDEEAEDAWLHSRKLERKCCENMYRVYTDEVDV